MNIVICTGGTGSIALQTGLYDLFEKVTDNIDIKILTNAYDNGLSTGIVRKVLDGKILGPSDVRKNQTTRLKLENPKSPWLHFLNIRFTCESKKAKYFCLNEIDNLHQKLQNNHIKQVLIESINIFFANNIAEKIDYTDFSLANILYAGLAKLHNNSLRTAAKIMAEFLGIKDNVLLNDDKSLFLGAHTQNGIEITDEADIVSWNNPNNPIIDVFFTDEYGNDSKPILCDEAKFALLNADLIIISSGTLWSSLIPTFKSKGFVEAVSHSNAQIIMIMNKFSDKDCVNLSGNEIIQLLIPKYFPKNRVHCIVDKNGSDYLSNVENNFGLKSVMQIQKSQTGEGVELLHDPYKLAGAIGKTIFKNYLDSEHFMFDYDDTLIGRGNFHPKSSNTNKKILGDIIKLNKKSISICSGNSIKAINLPIYKSLKIFADGGINLYSQVLINNDFEDFEDFEDSENIKYKFEECICPTLLFNQNTIFEIINILKRHGIPLSKVENRGNAIISIKPIDPEYRQSIFSLLKIILTDFNVDIKISGRTTIDIMQPGLTKQHAVKYVFQKDKVKSITYIGDEFNGGNDECILEMNNDKINCLSIKNPTMTAMFLITLNEYLNYK